MRVNKTRKAILVSFISMLYLFSYTQENSTWYFGNNCGIFFDDETNTATPVSSNNSFSGRFNSVVTNLEGEVQFYCNSTTLWNKNHEIVENGDGLLGDVFSSQNSLIIKQPDSDCIYYVFALDYQFTNSSTHQPQGLTYSILNSCENDGLGKITSKNNTLLNPTGHSMTYIESIDGESVWLINYNYDNDSFYAYKIDSNGLNPTPVISEANFYLSGDAQTNCIPSTMRFSQDGKTFVTGFQNGSGGRGDSSFMLYKFNGQTGEFHSPILIIEPFDYHEPQHNIQGVEISPNSNLLYVTMSNGLNGFIFQFDISSYDKDEILQSQVILYEGYLGRDIGGLQLAPDGKIYISISSSSGFDPLLSTITFPNVMGEGCLLEMDSYLLDETCNCSLGLTHANYSKFYSIFEYLGDCTGRPTEFVISDDTVVSANWNFNDPDSGANNTSTELNPTHTFLASGIYNVMLETTNGAGVVNVYEQEIEIFPSPSPNYDVTFTVCSGSDMATFPLSELDEIVSNDLANETISYFETEENAKDKVSQLTSPHTMQDGQLFARTENNNTNCYTISTVNVDVNFPIPVSQNATIEQCRAIDGTVNFILADANSEVTSETNVTITYHATQEDAEEGSNEIDNNQTTEQTVFARVVNNTGCYSISEVELIAYNLPVANSFSENFCSNQESNNITFSDYYTDISSENNLNFSFHTSQADAEEGTNALPDNYDVGTQIIYVRSENANNCISISTIDFTVSAYPLVGDNQSDRICFAYNNPGESQLVLEDYNSQFNLDSSQSLTYHHSEQEAIDNNNPIAQNESQTISSTTTYWVRVNNVDGTCSLIRELRIEIEDAWSVTNTSADACVELNQSSSFDLMELANHLVATPNDYSFNFYETAMDALNQSNKILNPDNYERSVSQIVFVNIENSQGCILQGEIALNINTNPQPTPTELEECNENNEAQFSLVDARELLNPSDNNWAIQFYENQTDANNETNPLPDFYSTATNQIIAIVTDIDTNCRTQTTVDLKVYNFPSANEVSRSFCALELPISINLTDLASEINATETVRFYSSEMNAEQNQSPLTNQFDVNTSSDNLFARVENDQCFIIQPIEIVIEPETRNLQNKAFACIGEVITIEDGREISETGTYEVFDIDNCVTTIYEYEFKECENSCKPDVPSAITPNGDGMNDTFRILTPNRDNCVISIEQVTIYNRWGEQVYQGVEDWTGFVNNQSSQGIYLYEIQFSSTSVYGEIESDFVNGVVRVLY